MNEQNLKPFPLGQSGNPNGRHHGMQNSSTRLLRFLKLKKVKKDPVTGKEEKFTVAKQMDMALIEKSISFILSQWPVQDGGLLRIGTRKNGKKE